MQDAPNHQQLMTPPPSHAPVISEPVTARKAKPSTPSFKKPSTPASAAPIDTRNQQAGTAESRASSNTLAAPHTQREPSIASARTGATHNRKRAREIDLSSEEGSESDYAPSEPGSPTAERFAGKAEARSSEVRRIPVKKSKAADGTAVNLPRAHIERVQSKNGFGFKLTSTTKSKTPTKPQYRESAPLISSSPAAGSPSARAPATSAKAPAPKKSSKKPFIPQPSKRAAARKAIGKIHGYSDDVEEFRTECAIEEADKMEDARLPDEMRRISITPAPSNNQRTSNAADAEGDASATSQHNEDEDMLVDIAASKTPPAPPTTRSQSQTKTNKSIPSSNAPAKGNNYTAWSQTRARGDRHLSKQGTVQDADDDSDLDKSEYMYINGVIVHKNEVMKLDLTHATQTMASRVIGAGRLGLETNEVGSRNGFGNWGR